MDAVSKNQKTTKGFKMKIDYKFEYRGFVSAHDPSSIKGLKAACQADFQKRRAK